MSDRLVLPPPSGRISAAQKAMAEKVAQKKVDDSTIARASLDAPAPTPTPSKFMGQEILAGYRVMKNFSDVQVAKRIQRIIPAGTLITDRKEVERLVRAGCMMEPVTKSAD